jgi:hypothetical protein
MKKYLMTGIAAVAMCAAFTSCSKDLGFEQMTQEEAMQSKYEAAFIKAFGQPSPDQDWGFGPNSSGITRVAETNSNQWFDGVTEKFKHLVQPADVTAREEEVVAEWFETHKNPTCDEISLTEFFVQQVHFGSKVYYGTDNNGASHSVVGGQHMDWLFAYSPSEIQVYLPNGQQTSTHMDHINNFNTSSPQRTASGLQNMQLMMNSSTENFGYHESFNTESNRYYNVKDVNWVIKAIEVDGVVGYYVGFDYESHGNQGDYAPDGYFDDRIIKIVPGTGYPDTPPITPPSGYQGRIMAEDLNAGEKSDFDFNDVVFDWKIDGRVATIQLLAAGGTLPLYVGGEEVHDKFGVFLNDMVNTGVKTAALPEPYTYTFPEGVAAEANNIPIIVTKGGTTAELTAVRGKVASKINVSTTTKWVKEYKDITLGYPKFELWVSDPTVDWTSDYNSTYLY